MDWIPCLFVSKHRLFYVFLIVLFFSGTFLVPKTYGYDILDPDGKVTIRWDVMQENDDGTQEVRVSIVNYQAYRHVEFPGWKLTWAWPGNEVIWNIFGGEATEQGNCSAFKGRTLPHCCDKEPVIVDLLPGAPFNKQVANCCKGGVLSSTKQDPSNSLAAIQMHIGVGPDSNASVPGLPVNFSLGLPGYTCGPPFQVPPTKFTEDQGRRRTQSFATWNITCMYSHTTASPVPNCCVSLSAFYNETIVPCPVCSCACQGQAGSTCLNPGELPPVLQLKHDEQPQPVFSCSDHMCPIKVHWHVKQSYREYWRVKITIQNLNHVKNYSDWSLVAVHPNLSNVTQVFSFNYKSLDLFHNDTGMFYGIEYYNDMLLQAGENGNVQTEMLLHKDQNFSFRGGFAFPRRIYFNGDACVIPPPDKYPRLPNAAPSHFHALAPSIISLIVSTLVLFLFTTFS